MAALIAMTRAQAEALNRHLLDGSGSERAAFALCTFEAIGSEGLFAVRELDLPQDGVESTGSEFHLAVDDAVIARVIKRAHDTKLCIVELHSHPFDDGAEFSPSDLAGLDELVPHVRWRLRGRPYAALVVAPDGFDGLAWIEAGERFGSEVSRVEVDEEVQVPSGRTLRRRRASSGEDGDHE